MRRAAGVFQTFAQQRHHFAIGAPALGRVLVKNHVVKGRAQNHRLVADVAVAPVARAADDDAAPLRGHGVDGFDQRAHRVRVVAVVGNHGGARVVHHVKAPRRVVRVGDKAGQAALDGVPAQTGSPGGADGGHHVFDLKANAAAARDRNVGECNALYPRALGGHQHRAINVQRALALRPVRGHQRVMAVGGKEDHLAGAGFRHASDVGVGGVQHRVAAGRDVLHDHALEHGQVFDGGDVVQPQMVAAADVGDDGDFAAVKAQPFAQHAAPGDFKHRRVHVWVHQHVAGAFRAAAIAAVGLAAIDIHAVGVGHAGAQALRAEQVGDQARRGGFAVGAGDGNHRNAPVVARREQLVNHRGADGPGLAVRRRQMHAQPRRGVDLDDAAVLRFQRLPHAFADDIDAADVQANHLRSGHGAGGDFGVNLVGHVGGGAAGA